MDALGKLVVSTDSEMTDEKETLKTAKEEAMQAKEGAKEAVERFTELVKNAAKTAVEDVAACDQLYRARPSEANRLDAMETMQAR